MVESNESLSDRELDVLAEVVQGLTNKEIAESLVISPNTVKVHLRNIYAKLGVSSRTEATVAAVEQGLIKLSGEIPAQPVEADEPEDGGDEAPGAVEADSIPLATPPGPAAVPLPAAGPEDRAGRWPFRIWPLVAAAALLLAMISLAWPWLSGQNIAIAPGETPGTDGQAYEEVQIADTRWFTTRPLPSPRQGLVLVAVGVNLYQIGGEAADGVPTGAVAVFDTTDRVWETATVKPTAVSRAGGANLFGEIYVVGGRLAGGRPTAVAEAYSPAQDTWRPIAALPQPLWGGLVLSDGGYLYHLGGMNEGAVVPDSYVYDPSANAWRALPPLPGPRAHATGGVIEGKLIVVGGTDGDLALRDCLIFDPVSEAWGDCPPLTAPRSQAGAAVVLNKLYVVGGDTTAHYGELYDPKAGVWQIINMPMIAQEGETGWPLLGVANVEARIYSFGGRLAGGEPTTDAYVYAPLVYQSFIPSALNDGDGGR